MRNKEFELCANTRKKERKRRKCIRRKERKKKFTIYTTQIFVRLLHKFRVNSMIIIHKKS